MMPGKPAARQSARLVLFAVAIGMALLAIVSLPFWLPSWLLRETSIVFLWTVALAQIAGFVLIPVALAILGVVLALARRKRVRKPYANRLLLLAVSTLFALGCAEAVAAWVAAVRFMPRLPTSFPADRDHDPAKELRIVAIGESSALGVPYKEWLSVPAVVAWQLKRVFPGRKVSVEMLALGGATLAQVHGRLARLDHRPDAILVFSGHNEFQILVTWDRAVSYYVDDNPPGVWDRLEELARSTSLGTVAVETIANRRVNRPPPRRVTRNLIDVPAFTAGESARLLDDFARRLDAIAAYAHSVGALPIIIVPPSNQADYEPNRSVLLPGTRKAEARRIPEAVS